LALRASASARTTATPQQHDRTSSAHARTDGKPRADEKRDKAQKREVLTRMYPLPQPHCDDASFAGQTLPTPCRGHQLNAKQKHETIQHNCQQHFHQQNESKMRSCDSADNGSLTCGCSGSHRTSDRHPLRTREQKATKSKLSNRHLERKRGVIERALLTACDG
jgi:hypothetical protein